MADDDTTTTDDKTAEQLRIAREDAKTMRLDRDRYRKELDGLRGEYDRLKDSATADLSAAMKKAADDADKLRIDLTSRATAAEMAAAEARTKAQERVRDADLRNAINDAGLRKDIKPSDALKLLDSATLKLNDDGEIINAAEAMAAFKADKPFMFGPASTSSTAAPPPAAPSAAKNALDMSADERRAGAKALGITALA
ncbi:MAG: phage scaffolding protein [Janthinobacterium lividum]